MYTDLVNKNKDESIKAGRPAKLLDVIHKQQGWLRYLAVLVLVALATTLDLPFHTRIAPTNLAMIYLVVVVIAAAYLGRGPAILASVLGVLAFDYFFVPPFLTLRVLEPEYLITFAGLLGVGLIISELTVRSHEQAESAKQRERDTFALYALSRDLSVADSEAQIIQAMTRHIQQIFDCDVELTFTEQEAIEPVNLPWQVALQGSQGTAGRLNLRPRGQQPDPTPHQCRLLEAFANLAAQAIDRLRLAERAQQVQVMQETERLQAALLNSISHDLRTPLVSITGSLSTLKESGIALDSELHNSLIDNAYQEARRLNRLVSNLLNMTRLEAGVMKVTMRPEDVEDVIGSALEPLNERLGNRPVHVEVPPDLPPVPMDFVLITQVLVNLIDNAIKYSPEGSPIDIKATSLGTSVEIQVADRGVGIPKENLERVFNKFFRIYRPGDLQRAGTGLGLSICKGIVEAHGGAVRAENRPGGGSLLTIRLPLAAKERM